MTIWRFIKILAKEQPRRLAVMITALVFAGLLEGSSVALFIPLLQLIQAGGADGANVGRMGQLTESLLGFFGLSLSIGNILVLIFATVLGMQLALLTQQRLSLRYQYDYEAALRERLYRAIFLAEWPFFYKNKAGDLINAIVTEAARAGKAFSLLNMMVAGAIVVVTYMGLAMAISWQMALTATLAGVVVVLALQRQVRQATQEGVDITAANTDVQSEALEQVSGAKLVKGSGIERETIDRFRQKLKVLANAQFRSSYNNIRLRVFHELSVVGLLCFGIYFAVVQLRMPITTLIVFLIIFYRLAPRLSNLQTFRRQLLANLPAVERVEDLRAEAHLVEESFGDLPFDRLREGIVLNEVDFSYSQDHGAESVIKKMKLEIPSGKTIAIVGGSGAGKSTLVDLVMGLITPASGELLVDGRPLQEYDLHQWRRHIGYVAQETVLFHATVRENIAWATPEATDAEIEAAAEAAYAREFIEELPDGFETIIGDRGVRLSGGQKQRLALAAALIRKPELLILDEATSALDAESERKIQEAVESLAELNLTIVIVTHRLSTVRNADIIYVVDNGELIEQGDWDGLVDASGTFDHFKRLQALD